MLGATEGTPVEAALMPGGCRGAAIGVSGYLCLVKSHGTLAPVGAEFTAGGGAEPAG